MIYLVKIQKEKTTNKNKNGIKQNILNIYIAYIVSLD